MLNKHKYSCRVMMISKALIVGAYHKKLEEIVNLGVDLHLIVPDRWGNQKPEVNLGKGYSIHQLPIVFSGKGPFHMYLGLKRLIKEIKPDILHIDEESYSIVTYQVMRFAIKYKIPAIFFNWQNIFKKYPFPFSYFERYNFAHSSAAIAGSIEVKSVLLKKDCLLPIYVIPQFGVDTTEFRGEKQQAFRNQLVKCDAFVIGFAGRFVKEKGVNLLIDVCTRLPENVHLLLIGAGPQKREFLQQAHMGKIDHRVHIIDFVRSNEMPKYLNALDCLVLPSLTRSNWKEQFGRILIEAMACEIPVIGSSSGEIPKVIASAGQIFPEGDTIALELILLDLIENKTKRLMLAKAGREHVLKYYTQKIIATQTIEVYREILQKVGK